MPAFKKTLKYALIAAALCIAAVLMLNAIVVLSARSKTAASASELAHAQAAIILGAGVYSDGRLTPVLAGRADAAIDIYKQGIVDKMLVSGDNGDASYNEVVPVRDYLLNAGVPSEDIFLDYAGFDTYDSMYRARAVFEVESAIVTTQSFHLPRAVFLAHAVGIDIQGLAADAGKELTNPMNQAREMLARIKAVKDVVLKSSPTYLGEKIPITGDGSVTAPAEPREATLTGVQICLPHKVATGPQTLECAIGIKTTEGDNYALDFNLMSATPPNIQNGKQFTASGVITPVEALSADHWQKYDVKGIFSVTSVATANVPAAPLGKCFIGGCSGQICSDQEGMASDCMYRPEYACYKNAACERQATGACGWTETAELKACIANGGEI